MTWKSVGRLLVCLAICLGVGILGSIATRPEIPTWYASLNKPGWTPPPFAFPLAWTTLYILMAVAWWRLWDRTPIAPDRGRALHWFIVQLVLNAVWSPVFFGWHGIRTGLVIIALLFAAIFVTIAAASRVDRIAAWLLVPYLLWVAYATTINAGVVALN